MERKTGSAKTPRAPWKRPNPKKGRGQKLSPEAKEWAKERAKRAGRPYPNLVDNMKAAERERARK